MQHITRLLIRARKATRKATSGENKTVFGFVDYDIAKKKYTCSGYVWDGVPGSVTDRDTFYSEHDTAAEAEAAASAIAEKYPLSESITFLVDDLSFPVED